MPTIIGYKPGPTVSWLNTGGSKIINIVSMAGNVVRQGQKSANFCNIAGHLPAFISWRFESHANTGPSTGRSIQLYVGQSDSDLPATGNPGNLNGADGILGAGIELLGQLDKVGAIILSNLIGTGAQRVWLTSFPRSPYQIPVVFNDAGTSLGSTAAWHGIYATPYYQTIDSVA
jgi:hypothetical protein